MRERSAVAVVGSASARTIRAPDPAGMLEALPVALVLLGAGDRFLFANPAAEHLLGLSAAVLAQTHLTELLPAGNPLFSLLAQVRARGMTVTDRDLVLESPRLRRREVMAQGTPLQEMSGAVLLVLGDATAARALDRQVLFRGGARSLGGMAAVLAHEVKNPLSGIRGAAQLLEDTVAANDRELCALIRDEADRIRAILDRMETFSDKSLAREAVNIHRVLDHVRRLARSGFATGIPIREDYDPSLPPVWGNRDELVQVLLNLVKNAAEAITESGTSRGEITLLTAFRHGMRVSTSPGGRSLPLAVTVRDNGPGIPAELRRDLFEPFVTTRPAGSGLGLALVAKIVDDHDGMIEVESRPGRTEIRLLLPMAREERAAARPEEPA